LKNLLKKIFLIVNLAFALLLLLSYLSIYISPENAWIFAFIGFGYPYILLLNVLFVVFWISFRKWYFLLSLVIILTGWGSMKKLFQLRGKKDKVEFRDDSFKVLSYNVRLFNYYLWERDTSAGQKIMDFIEAEDPSVICFQEFLTLSKGKITLARIKKEMEELPYSHVYYTHRIAGKSNFGMATFSKYPIVNKGFIKFENSLNGSIFSDIIIQHDTLRIYNCHLQSIWLRQDYNAVLDSLISGYDDKRFDEFRYISVKLRDAYIKRAFQAEQLSRHIKESPYPVIICGDFNDTPFSYSYYKVSRNLKDAFMESGSGIGSTYRENFPPIRIDYILHSPSLRSAHFVNKRISWSDHYPVLCEFTFVQKGDSSGQHSHP
jgi:endonuclease/exonuclease/phosphatase family metal-dependent hydrolase